MTIQEDTFTASFDFSVRRYDELSSAHIESWKALCRAHEDYDSALLTPDFAEVIARVRDDVRIVLGHQNDRLKAALAIHLRPDGLARPLGTPFSDYSGPVFAEDCPIGPAEMLRGAGIGAFESHAMPDPWNMVPGKPLKDSEDSGGEESHIIRANPDEGTSLLESQRARHPKRFKNFRRQRHQIERDAGELKFEWGRPGGEAFTSLLDHKRDQYRKSGLVDLTTATEASRLLRAVAESENAFQTTLWLDDQFLAGHFGFRAGTSFHPWIAAFNPAFGHYSPGSLLLLHVLETMPEMGIETYDLSEGHDHYKKYFANAVRVSQPVFMTGSGVAAFRQKAAQLIWQGLGAGIENSYTGRLRRRMEQIAVSEFSLTARTREFAYAVAARTFMRRKH